MHICLSDGDDADDTGDGGDAVDEDADGDNDSEDTDNESELDDDTTEEEYLDVSAVQDSETTEEDDVTPVVALLQPMDHFLDDQEVEVWFVGNANVQGACVCVCDCGYDIF